jgi:AAA domain
MSDVVALPALSEMDVPAILREGMGYRGVWHRQSIVIRLTRVQAGREGLSGIMRVHIQGRPIFSGRFNIHAVTTRKQVATYLREQTDGYSGWSVILERFCAEVDELAEEGTPLETLADLAPPSVAAYRMEQLIPLGFPTLLYGPGGAMKSTLAASIAVSVATGAPLLDWIPHPGPVIILDWESGRDEWHRRLSLIARGLGVAFPRDLQYRRCEGSLAGLAERLTTWVAEKEVALVVVDSVGLASGQAHEGGDASETALRLFRALRDINTTTLLIDHVTGENVGNDRTGRARPYGSVFKMNLSRSCWELRKEERGGDDGTQLLLKHTKVNEGRAQRDRGLKVTHLDTEIRIAPCEVSAPDLETHAGTVVERMAMTLGREGMMTVASLAEAVGASAATVRVYLQRNKDRFLRLDDKQVALRAFG